MSIHPSSRHDFVRAPGVDPILEKVATNAGKDYRPCWRFAGLLSALIVKGQTLRMDDQQKADFISKKMKNDKLGPEALRWFSDKVIEQIRTSDPKEMAYACACARAKTTKVALAVAFLNCWEKQSAQDFFKNAREKEVH